MLYNYSPPFHYCLQAYKRRPIKAASSPRTSLHPTPLSGFHTVPQVSLKYALLSDIRTSISAVGAPRVKTEFGLESDSDRLWWVVPISWCANTRIIITLPTIYSLALIDLLHFNHCLHLILLRTPLKLELDSFRVMMSLIRKCMPASKQSSTGNSSSQVPQILKIWTYWLVLRWTVSGLMG